MVLFLKQYISKCFFYISVLLLSLFRGKKTFETSNAKITPAYFFRQCIYILLCAYADFIIFSSISPLTFFLCRSNLWLINVYCFCFGFVESVCPTRIPVAARDEKGFDILLGLGVKKKVKKRIPLSPTKIKGYEVTATVDLSEFTR